MPEVVTTYLQLSALKELVPARASDPDFVVREAVERQWRVNRSLYLLVGERWAWVDKQLWSDQQWESYAASEQLRTFVASWRGFGGGLLTDALERAWTWDARRVWVHTCTLDHEAALRNYQARGMRVYDRRTHQVA